MPGQACAQSTTTTKAIADLLNIVATFVSLEGTGIFVWIVLEAVE